MSLYVRTSSAGTGPAVWIKDLGITIGAGVGWTLLLKSSITTPDSGTGLFSAREIRDSQDLYLAITGGDLEWSSDGLVVSSPASYTADIGYLADLSDDMLGGSTLFEDIGDSTVALVAGYDNVRADQVQLVQTGIYVGEAAGNLVFKDTFSTQTTLTELKSMRNIWIVASGLSEGNITLNDSTNWNAQYTFVGTIHVVTTSTKWDLSVCETSAFDLASPRSRKIVTSGKSNMVITANLEVNSDSNNLYLVWDHTLATPAPTVSFYITGEARRH